MYESMITQSLLTTISAEISKTKERRQNCRKIIFPYDVVGGGYNIDNTVRAWALAWNVLCGADAEGQDANIGLGGVMLESTDWHGGLRDRQLLVDSRQQDIIVQDINTTIEKIKTNVFSFSQPLMLYR